MPTRFGIAFCVGVGAVTALALLLAAAWTAAPATALGPYPSLGGCPVFPPPQAGLSPRAPSLPTEAAWNQDVSKAPVAPGSAATIAYIDSHGGDRLHPDFGSPRAYGFPYAVLSAGRHPLPGHYTAYGDESDPGPFPIPLGAPVEGGARSDGDRHLLAVDRSTCTLFELYRAFSGARPPFALERRLRRPLGPALRRPAPRLVDLGRRRRAADLPGPRPL